LQTDINRCLACSSKLSTTSTTTVQMKMMVAQTPPQLKYEIKVALLGSGKVGKTSLLRLLLNRPYLRCHDDDDDDDDSNHVDDDDLGGNKSIHRFRVSNETSTTETVVVESSNYCGVEVKEYRLGNIVDPIFRHGKDNVDLVFEDIGGQCHGGALKEYLKHNWHTIDCLIFVADLTRSVYTSHDEEIFNLVDEHMSRKEVPLLIVGNKFDDPTDNTVVKRAQQVRKILDALATQSKSPKSAVKTTTAATTTTKLSVRTREEEKKEDDDATAHRCDDYSNQSTIMPITPPEFVAISSRRAFTYQYLSTREKDELMDEGELIEEILSYQMDPLEFLKLSEEMKLDVAWNMLHGDGKKDILTRKNALGPLCQLQHWIKRSIFEEPSQVSVLQRQQAYDLTNLSPSDPSIVSKLRQIHYSPWRLQGGDPKSLVSLFWALYHACEDNALAEFHAQMDVSSFKQPLSHLTAYRELVLETQWEPLNVIVEAVGELLRRQLNIIVQHHHSYSFDYWFNERNEESWRKLSVGEVGKWKFLSPCDWATIYNSILVVAADRHFVENLGKQKLLLEQLLYKSYDRMYKDRYNTTGDIDLNAGTTQCKNHTPKKRISRIFRGRRNNIKKSIDHHGSNDEADDDGNTKFKSIDGCPSLSHALDGFYSLQEMGKFIPKYPETYGCVVRLETPASPSDPTHFGHVAWVYCKMLEVIDEM
jgi:GTPase SAR1 family protein